MRILIVEDDAPVAQALVEMLSNHNYAVEVAVDGAAGWEMVATYEYDLLLLDVVLPQKDGIWLCQQIRAQGYTMPILLLTGRDSGHDKAVGLDAGADDYVVKPFDAEELVARVRALLRRSGQAALPVLSWGALRLDPTSCEVTFGQRLLSLTPKEYALLELFLRNSRRVFSCGMILEHLWAYDETPGEEAVRTHIKGLRQKLKTAGLSSDVIETVYGIGYRLKPLAVASPAALSAPQEAIAPTSPPTATTLLLKTWNRFRGRISEQVGVLEETVRSLQSQTLSDDLRQRAIQEAHTLAGSLGTFGFPQGSRLARQAEHLLQASADPAAVDLSALQERVRALRAEIERSPQTLAEPEDNRPLLLVIEADRELGQRLVQEADRQGLRGAIALSPSSARRQFEQDRPEVVLLDLELSDRPQDGLQLLVEFNRQRPTVPVLVYSRQAEVEQRLAIAQHGRHTFLPKPLPPDQILEAVVQALQRIDKAAARIMVVDDDPEILRVLRSLLPPWGLQVTGLSDPRHFWDTLESCTPDLLVLDVEMPHQSGIELCQVIRNDARWGGLPILFLTAHSEPETVERVFTAGADDFIRKPLVEPELVTRIINRLERLKLLRERAEIDPLTQVANRQKSTQDLDRFLQRAAQQQQPLGLAVLDVDHLKRINACHGHAVGDAVLRQLGQLLQQAFRQEAVVARWGGGEFVVGLYGAPLSTLMQRLLKVQERLQHHEFPSPENICSEPGCDPDAPILRQVTFSAGLAEFPADGGDVRSLYQSADTALQQAKRDGRDRIVARLAMGEG